MRAKKITQQGRDANEWRPGGTHHVDATYFVNDDDAAFDNEVEELLYYSIGAAMTSAVSGCVRRRLHRMYIVVHSRNRVASQRDICTVG